MPDFFQRCIFSDLEEIFISLTFSRTCGNHEPCFWHKTIGGISSHRPQVFPCVIPCMYTQEHVKHLLQSPSNKTRSIFKSNVHQGNPKWWTKFKKKICKIRRFGVIIASDIHRVLFCLCLQDEDKIYHRWSLRRDHRAVS